MHVFKMMVIKLLKVRIRIKLSKQSSAETWNFLDAATVSSAHRSAALIALSHLYTNTNPHIAMHTGNTSCCYIFSE